MNKIHKVIHSALEDKINVTRKDRVLVVEWFGSLTEVKPQIKKAILESKQLDKHKKCEAWLLDFTKCPNYFSDSESWLFSEFIPQIVGAGYERIAIARNHQEFVQGENRIIQIKNFVIGHFNDTNRALKWLEKSIY